jgi:hypothetical protein
LILSVVTEVFLMDFMVKVVPQDSMFVHLDKQLD